MAAMEDQLRKLNPEPPAPEPAPEPKEAPAPDATGDSSDPPPPPAPPRQLQLGIARLKWDQFDKIGTSGKYVIDVLIGDPDYMKPRQRKKGAKQTEKYNTTDDKDKKAANNEKKEENESTQPRSASASEKRSLLPERMCINSDLLVKMLNEITLLNMVGPLVIIRPFKVLVNWETEIRQRLEVLEQKEADAVAAKAKEAESLKREEEEQTEEKTENHVESTVSAEPSIEKTNKIIETTKSVSDEKQTEGEQIKDSHDGGSKTENVQANNNTVTEKDPGPKLSEEERKGQSSHADEVAEYDELDADIYSTDGKPALKRLRLLVKFMDEEISGPLKKLKEARRHQQVFFADLYHFFVPGDEVYGNLGSGTTEKVQAYRILQCTGGRRYNLSEKSKEQTDSLDGLSSMGSPLVVTCIHIDFNGKEFGPVTTTFPIPEYLGERSTSSLPIWPLAFMEEPQDLKRGLELRGKRFIELAQVSHKEYTGLTIDPKEDIDSQIIVDFETAFQYNPDWTPDLDIKYPATSDPRETAALSADDNNVYEGKGIVLDSYENEYSYTHEDATIDQTRMEDYKEDHPIFRRDLPVLLKATQNGVELNDDDKRLLPRRVFGFVLRSRTWASISIHLVRDLPIKQDGFDQLVLPDGHRDLVRALVKTHSRGSRPAYGSVETDHQVDLVKGKGKGLIILLHGVPGVGKTSTAECIADYTQRPLFPITCGDIGETATAVEANLGKNFQLAHKWGCVLLLDEADVFMAKRSGSDIQRNSLVSGMSFLR